MRLPKRSATRRWMAGGATVAVLAAGGAVWAGTASASSRDAVVSPHAMSGFTITTSSDAVSVGDTVTVTVAATRAKDLYAYDLSLHYDPSMLSYVADSATTDNTGSTYATPGTGEITAIHTKLGSSPTANGEVDLMSFTFTALADGTTSLSVPTLTEINSKDATTNLNYVASSNLEIAKLAAPTAGSLPVITGTPEAGYVLTAHTPTWSVSGVKVGYQWMRGGVAIKGATKASYAATRADAGTALSVEVTASKPTYATGMATSKTVRVAKAATTTGLKAQVVSAKKGSVRVAVTVKAHGLTPVGTVRVKLGGQTRTVKLVGGKATVTVKVARHGKFTVHAAYLPAAGFSGSSATGHVTRR